jgi:ankyrin repeat protein
MSDAVPLPPHPSLEYYRKLAKDLCRACEARDDGAIRAWAARWIENVARLRDEQMPHHLERDTERLLRRWKERQTESARAARCLLSDAQFFVAREHGFASWPKFAAHLESLADTGSAVFRFEQAADAIVRGDTSRLARLVAEHPGLVRARSTRDHRSTLLHYVSANGIEDYRQKTPKNIVEIADLLLRAGADPDAASDAYGGGSTPLGLTATSVHPETAGVQIELLKTLLAHGAKVDKEGAGGNGHGAIEGCLANGQGGAARFLASLGVPLNFLEAAGVCRLDIVKERFAESAPQQREMALLYACGYGCPDVAEFLLRQGVNPGADNGRGQTGLHWAMYAPHVEIVRILIRHGAPVEARDAAGASALDWAREGLAQSTGSDRERYEEIITMLERVRDAT